MRYALIENGSVVNVIEIRPRNAEQFTNAIKCEGLAVSTGDTFSDGAFFHDGERIKSRDEIYNERINELSTNLDIITEGVPSDDES